MNRILLNRLRLENFKCHRLLELDFQGRDASLFGDNAAGKTSIYDALTWLLFGKDSRGNGEKNIDLKPLDAAGEVADHMAITAVEAEFRVDGITTTFRRTLKEVWSTRRGSSDAVYDGNTSEYYVDGVPCKKFAFEGKIAEIIPEDTFRLLTSVTHFAQDMAWKDRRAILFEIAGVSTDRQIMETDERFRPLVEAMGRLSLDDLKKKLLSQRRELERAKTDIPARIAENQELLERYRGADYAALEARRESLRQQKSGLEQDYAQARSNSLLAAKKNQLGAVQNDIRALENQNQAHRREQGQPGRVASLTREYTQATRNLEALKASLGRIQAEEKRLDDEINQCRSDWVRFNGMVFQGGICPTCGQNLPAQALEKARQEHQAMVDAGKETAISRSAVAKERSAQCQAEASDLQNQIQQAQQQIAGLEKELEAAQAAEKEVQDMPGYAAKIQELQEMADALINEIFNLESDTTAAASGIRAKIRGIEDDLAELDRQIARKTMIPEIQSRLDALRAQSQEGAARLEELDSMLFLMEEFTRHKAQFVEDSINSRFNLARFRLFRTQANGGLEERCDVTVSGIPYSSLNNGARINVGMDIINTLSAAYGVRVPLFVDNAESVTRLEDAGTQVIRLVVSEEDKEVRCEYED